MASSEQKIDMKFRGPTAISLDSKHRLAVPMRYREIFNEISGGNVIVTAHPHGCLLLYPADTWYPVEEAIMSKPSLDLEVATTQGITVGMATNGALDATGRVLLSAELREYADLDKEVMLVGQFSHFRIWSKAAWDAQTEAAKPATNKPYVMPESFADINF